MEKDAEDFHFKGILPGTAVRMKQLISPYSHQVISLQLINRAGKAVQAFFFDMGEGISTDIQHQDNKVASLTLVPGPHVCEGDALVVALEGEGR